MNIITTVWFEHNKIFVEFNDGRIVGTPIEWYPNLRKGTMLQMNNYELWDGGRWIHWEELDEDLSAEGFLTFRSGQSLHQ